MNTNERELAELVCRLISELILLQKKLHTSWRGDLERLGAVNFKSLRVYKVINDAGFFNIIDAYRDKLHEPSTYASVAFVKASFSNLGKLDYRVKELDSYRDKLVRYTAGPEGGKIPVNKCLNDLAGFRIQLPVDLPADELMAFIIAWPFQTAVRCVNSSKNGYYAIHVYLKDCNQMPMWELQIWNHCDIKKVL